MTTALRCSLARYKDHRPFSIVVYINTCCIHTICRPPPARYYKETNSYCCNSFHTNTIGSGSDFNPQLDLLWIRIRLGVHLKTNSMLIITSHILFAVTPQAHSLLSTDKAKQMKCRWSLNIDLLLVNKTEQQRRWFGKVGYKTGKINFCCTAQ